MIDQANKLRELVVENGPDDSLKNHQIKIYSIVSGKGGVGKTNFTINLAIKLQQAGKRVLILDADIGMCNANILLGIEMPYSLYHLLQGEVKIEDIITKGPYGVALISGGAELLNLDTLDEAKQKDIVTSLCDLDEYDILLIDNGAGLSKQSIIFTVLADEMILITTPEPTAITDAYRVLKAISLSNLKSKVKVVINQINDLNSGEIAFNKLLLTSQYFLHLDLENFGYIFNDIRVNKAIMEQSPFVISYPNSLASNNLSQICNNILGDKDYSHNISNVKQLRNRLIKLFG